MTIPIYHANDEELMFENDMMRNETAAIFHLKIFSLKMVKIALFLTLLGVLGCINAAKIAVPAKSYACQADGSCRLIDNSQQQVEGDLSQSTCLLTCGKGYIWPYPTGDVTIGSALSPISVEDMKFTFSNDDKARNPAFSALFQQMKNNFNTEVTATAVSKGSAIQSSNIAKTVSVVGNIRNHNLVQPSPSNDESYSLKITSGESIVVDITAETIFGYRHGLETLSQLIVFDDINNAIVIAANVSIIDQPAFPYRGVMIDVARNFISLAKLEENIRGLGANKMNVLHLHLSDTASFPVSLPSNPQVTSYGAYNSEQMYTVEDIQGLVTYAASYGVMILPEVDAPAHMAAGWQFGSSAGLGELVLCADPQGTGGHQWATDALEPPSGQLNLANPNSLSILNSIYGDVIAQIPSPYFHLGGDEVIVGSDDVTIACYNSSTLGKPILDYLTTLGFSRNDQGSFYALWENFTVQATHMVQSQYKALNTPLEKLHIWGGGGYDSSGTTYNLLTQPNVQDYLPPNVFTVQVWDEKEGSITPSLIQQGYDVILSNTDYVYLDCGNAGFTNAGGYWCQPYHEWYHIYEYIQDVTKTWQLTTEDKKKIKGSETLAWTEMIDDENLSQKLWPRSAALAEALWSDPQHGWYEAADRMLHWRNTLVKRGVHAEALQPQWCLQREQGVCSRDSGKPQ